MTGFRVVIPSARRSETIAGKTLTMLASGGIDRSAIDLYVPDDDDLDRYSATVGDLVDSITVVPHDPERHDLDAIGVHPTGVGVVRNAIVRRYPPGARLVYVDDDLTGVIRRTGEQSAEPIADLPAFFDAAFDLADRHGCSLWGVYPVKNPYFMRDRVRLDLTYICGGLYGVTVSGGPHELVVLDDKEDFERSIRHFIADGAVARIEWAALATTGYQGGGGMQASRTSERVDQSARWLAATFPQFCSLNTSKRSGWTEVRLHARPR